MEQRSANSKSEDRPTQMREQSSRTRTGTALGPEFRTLLVILICTVVLLFISKITLLKAEKPRLLRESFF